jgi:hypothetical protein
MTTSDIASPVSSRARLRPWYDVAPVHVVVLAATFTGFAAYEASHLLAITNNDIWWRLRTGQWILENHAVPRYGLFSQWSALPWVDSSWGFDALGAFFYRLCGPAGLPLFLLCLQVAVAVALFALALRASNKFWPAIALAAVAQFCLMPLQPRPALCSIILLAIELALLLRAHRIGDARMLYWLPLVFVAWVNLDRQFSYGLLVLALFCVSAIIEQVGRRSGAAWLGDSSPALPLGTLGAVAAASFLATFVSPYGWRLHALLWYGATHSTADRYFRELHSLRFRQPQDYLLMLLAMTAFFALGRRRSRDLFLLALLLVSAAISFRTMRDNWFVVVCSVAIIGNALRDQKGSAAEAGQSSWRRWEKLAAAALVLIVITAARPQFARLPKLSETFPVRAADYIRQNHLPQPIFNTYEWGGFLTWYLPEYPVSIDSRADLYSDDVYLAYFKLTQAEVPLESDPVFARAQAILLEANSPMADALSTLPNFRVAYQDNVAVVLVRSN